MASKKAMQVEIDALNEVLRLMEASRDTWQKWCEHESNKVEHLRKALKEQNEQASDLHHDNAHLNGKIFEMQCDLSAVNALTDAQSQYIEYVRNR